MISKQEERRHTVVKIGGGSRFLDRLLLVYILRDYYFPLPYFNVTFYLQSRYFLSPNNILSTNAWGNSNGSSYIHLQIEFYIIFKNVCKNASMIKKEHSDMKSKCERNEGPCHPACNAVVLDCHFFQIAIAFKIKSRNRVLNSHRSGKCVIFLTRFREKCTYCEQAFTN